MVAAPKLDVHLESLSQYTLLRLKCGECAMYAKASRGRSKFAAARLTILSLVAMLKLVAQLDSGFFFYLSKFVLASRAAPAHYSSPTLCSEHVL